MATILVGRSGAPRGASASAAAALSIDGASPPTIRSSSVAPAGALSAASPPSTCATGRFSPAIDVSPRRMPPASLVVDWSSHCAAAGDRPPADSRSAAVDEHLRLHVRRAAGVVGHDAHDLAQLQGWFLARQLHAGVLLEQLVDQRSRTLEQQSVT